jgi:GTP-binding protein Era
MKVTHSGFVAILGSPNAGKSTQLNAILGEKLAIISPRPQTTRRRITGIYTGGGAQMIFLDTPGMLTPRNKLGEHMLRAVEDSIRDVDAAVFVTDASAEAKPEELELLGRMKAAKVKAVLAINKTDLVADKTKLIPALSAWSERYPFAAAVPVSASTGEGVDELVAELRALMPEGPQYYPDDQFTTEPERAIAAEMIREKLLGLMQDEVPHGTAVAIEKMSRRGDGLCDISAVIYCEKESHKGMIIGKGGAMLKKIGTLARADIERMLDCRVNLRLWVKVSEGWRNSGSALKDLGLG